MASARVRQCVPVHALRVRYPSQLWNMGWVSVYLRIAEGWMDVGMVEGQEAGAERQGRRKGLVSRLLCLTLRPDTYLQNDRGTRRYLCPSSSSPILTSPCPSTTVLGTTAGPITQQPLYPSCLASLSHRSYRIASHRDPPVNHYPAVNQSINQSPSRPIGHANPSQPARSFVRGLHSPN